MKRLLVIPLVLIVSTYSLSAMKLDPTVLSKLSEILDQIRNPEKFGRQAAPNEFHLQVRNGKAVLLNEKFNSDFSISVDRPDMDLVFKAEDFLKLAFQKTNNEKSLPELSIYLAHILLEETLIRIANLKAETNTNLILHRENSEAIMTQFLKTISNLDADETELRSSIEFNQALVSHGKAIESRGSRPQ